MSEPVAKLLLAANAALQAGQPDRAATHYRQIIANTPTLAEPHANLGLALTALGHHTEAEQAFAQALSLAPTDGRIHQLYANLLAAQKAWAQAEAHYRRGLELAPLASGWSNLGVLLASQGRDAEAEECHRTALRLDPQNRVARFNLAYVLLHHERYAEGWAHLEARTANPGPPGIARWNGDTLAGRSVLIGCEAGHGDMIQLARYASVLKQRGAGRIGVHAHPALLQLFTTLDDADEIIPATHLPTAHWDVWAPALSLPGLCRSDAETLPAGIPYLHAQTADLARWRARLPSGLRIGLVWRGSTGFENDDQRSLPSLSVLAPLGALAGIHLISLQKGAGEDEARQPPAALRHLLPWGETLRDFADTAALVAQLDLVIAVDTAVAHLAGALGIPCWVMLPWFKTDWRWQRAREDSPWYPSLRLFRQTRMGDWDSVVTQILTALAQTPPSRTSF